MSDARRLARGFFARPSTVVAPALLGKTLVRALPDGTRLAARLVETEAYEDSDPASHSFGGTTSRNRVMFGPAGHLYVYFTYGMHFCMNVVTGRASQGSAVLLRAAEPLEGLERMAGRRGTAEPLLLCSGPARLCQALHVDRTANGQDLVSGTAIWLERGSRAGAIAAGPRVGIRRAVDRPWRFWTEGDPFVSKGRGGRTPSIATRSAPPRR